MTTNLHDWYCFQLVAYNHKKMEEIDQWLQINCNGPGNQYKRVGWRGSCHHYVSVFLENYSSALIFKLMWTNNGAIDQNQNQAWKTQMIEKYENHQKTTNLKHQESSYVDIVVDEDEEDSYEDEEESDVI